MYIPFFVVGLCKVQNGRVVLRDTKAEGWEWCGLGRGGGANEGAEEGELEREGMGESEKGMKGEWHEWNERGGVGERCLLFIFYFTIW